MELSAGAIVAAGGVIFLGAVLQGSIGLGVAVISVPILTLIDTDFTPIAATGVSIKLTRRSRLAAGTISGITASTASIGGPPLVLLYRHRSGGSFAPACRPSTRPGSRST